jgi:nitroimidazol reductase NimA-like FMN-containing flavoprotein (pyridoxamine 5'-phosphate oxidase superfamily)
MGRPRHHVRRLPERARYDRAVIDAVLDAGLVAHVAFVDGGQPYGVPMLYARLGDEVYVHGSSASRAMRLLGGGAPACLTVTLLDGLVLAHGAFDHSVNYRSAMLIGAFRSIDDPDERLAAFAAFTDALLPSRWSEVRSPTALELRASSILAMPIDEATVKVRGGPPADDRAADGTEDSWAGVLPIGICYGSPQAAPGIPRARDLPVSVRMLLGADYR